MANGDFDGGDDDYRRNSESGDRALQEGKYKVRSQTAVAHTQWPYFLSPHPRKELGESFYKYF